MFGLQCYVGLGNSSQRENQKIVDCPAQGNYVCVKMFGGGMGDQIRRYCDKIPPKVKTILISVSKMSVSFMILLVQSIFSRRSLQRNLGNGGVGQRNESTLDAE